MKKILSAFAIICALSSLTACRPGVYLGPANATPLQNVTVMEEAPIPTASPAKGSYR